MYKLYNVKAWGSISIHCLLEEMEVPYTNIWMTAEQVRAPEFREFSPLGMIPALGLADGRTLYESAAIVSFLVAAHPDKQMSPQLGSEAYGDFMSLLHMMSTELYPTISLAFGGNAYAQTPEQDAFIVETAEARADTYWKLLEKRLTKATPWLMGRDFSALDIYAFMLSIWGRPSETALHGKFPAIAKLAASVRARPKLKAVLESHGVLELGGYPA
ncbi:glutathione S-transferase family protein [Aestuariivirga sp.]|uniref:glutathione S-transferase family protein n=1 Tax=Aestuariivirga sp. TaxID=2650926 RepID=UPI003593B58D